MSPIAQIVVSVLNLFNFLMIIWCLLSWFPNINWYDQPFKTLDKIVRPVIAPFRKIIPPIGNIDISPIVALLCLQGLSKLIITMVP
ncbi:MAG: YggT family protein [Candidatus Melainabacteria bacterium]|mgnify:CR=1 FL=1|nr:YggT family protein [Candidatus Melainabacteria bacterium]